MRRAAHAMEKQKRVSLSAPIQIVELDLVDRDESGFVGRLIGQIRLRVYRKGDHRRYCRPPILYFLCTHAMRCDAQRSGSVTAA